MEVLPRRRHWYLTLPNFLSLSGPPGYQICLPMLMTEGECIPTLPLLTGMTLWNSSLAEFLHHQYLRPLMHQGRVVTGRLRLHLRLETLRQRNYLYLLFKKHSFPFAISLCLR